MTRRVSIVVPCYNERRTIGSLLQSISDQTYPVNNLEVVIADGMSDDGSRAVIQEFARDHPELEIRLVDNPKRIIPSALNAAIQQAEGDIIVRLDAHSVPHRDYIERCLGILMETGAANAGGIWEIKPLEESWLARSIAAAASHPLGAGDARYRTSGPAGEVDTVPFGAFRREWIEKVGPFNEELATNEDYEYNVRLRQAGGIVWFDPSIRSIYFARPNLASLAKQYLRYGYWKAQMVVRFPRSLRWRQVLPPLFVLVLILVLFLSFPIPSFRLVLALQLGAYAFVTQLAGLGESFRRHDPVLIVGMPLALWIMHLSWGGAFLWGLLGYGSRERGRSSQG